jgi:hypothetical protein
MATDFFLSPSETPFKVINALATPVVPERVHAQIEQAHDRAVNIYRNAIEQNPVSRAMTRAGESLAGAGKEIEADGGQGFLPDVERGVGGVALPLALGPAGIPAIAVQSYAEQRGAGSGPDQASLATGSNVAGMLLGGGIANRLGDKYLNRVIGDKLGPSVSQYLNKIFGYTVGPTVTSEVERAIETGQLPHPADVGDRAFKNAVVTALTTGHSKAEPGVSGEPPQARPQGTVGMPGERAAALPWAVESGVADSTGADRTGADQEPGTASGHQRDPGSGITPELASQGAAQTTTDTSAFEGPDGSLELSLSGMRNMIVPEERMADEGHGATDAAQKMLDRAYDAAISVGKYSGVDAFIGGTGSGKSVTSEATPLSAERRAGRIILESHAENAETLADKIDLAIESGLPVDVHVVIRDPVESYKSAVGRYDRAEASDPGSGKVVPVNYGAATHEAVIDNVPKLFQWFGHDPLVRWHFIDNRGMPVEAGEVSSEEGLRLLAGIDSAGLRDRFNEVLDNTKLTRRDRERFGEQTLPAEFGPANRVAPEAAEAGDRGIPAGTGRDIIPLEEDWDYERRPGAGEAERQLAREAIRDLGSLRVTAADESGRGFSKVEESDYRGGAGFAGALYRGAAVGGGKAGKGGGRVRGQADRKPAVNARNPEGHGGERILPGLQGLGIRPELIQRGRVDLRGREIHTERDLAELGQVCRDPRFETFRIIYVRKGKVAATEAISSRLPGSSSAFLRNKRADRFYAETTKQFGPNINDWPSDLKEEYGQLVAGAEGRSFIEMQRRMHRLGADGYYLLHNHPGGEADPSPEDVHVSAMYETNMPGFKGHIVVDSGHYGVVDPSTATDIAKARASVGGGKQPPDIRWRVARKLAQSKRAQTRPLSTDDAMLEASIPHELLGQPARTSAQIAALGQDMKSPHLVTVFFLSHSKVRAIETVSEKLYQNTAEMTKWVRGRARTHGGREVVAYTQGSEELIEAGRRLMRTGSLVNAVAGEVGLEENYGKVKEYRGRAGGVRVGER